MTFNGLGPFFIQDIPVPVSTIISRASLQSAACCGHRHHHCYYYF